MTSNTTSRPLCIQVHPDDNVAIVVNDGGLQSGTELDSGLRLLEPVPQAHKVALADMAKGAAIIRYGVVIGHAQASIPRGSWVHEGVMSLPSPPPLDRVPLSTAVPPRPSPEPRKQ